MTTLRKGQGEVNKHILVVDDDEIFLGALAQTLEREGFTVTKVSHGKQAIDLISVGVVDAVLSDINMPGVSGIDLVKFAAENAPELPVILMTGFAELRETAEAIQKGARGFLPKPFKREELIAVLNEWLNPEKKEAVDANLDDAYCKLSIEDFVSGKEIKFNIYIRLSETKYLKVAHEGEDIPVDRIQGYKAKGIEHLHMLKDDFKRYMGFNLNLLPKVTGASSISRDKKRHFLKHTSEVILENLFLNGVDEESFQSARCVVESTASLLTEPDEMMRLMELLSAQGDHLYSHSLGVSVYAVMIAKEIKWTSQANVHKLALGGLLHDIGKKELPRALLNKPRRDMVFEEVQLYETHPQRGMDVLGQISTVPTDVLQIVAQHHEDCLGLGFPTHITKNYIHPMARIIAVADAFCSMILPGPDCLKLQPGETLSRMNTLMGGRYDPQFLAALGRIFEKAQSP